MSTPTALVAGSARSRRHTSNPLSLGIITSSRMMSGFQSRAAVRVSSPLVTMRVSKPLPSRWASSSSAFITLSSAMRMRGMCEPPGRGHLSDAAGRRRYTRSMRVIVNGRHAGHAPPHEADNGTPVPPWEVPGRVDAIRAALEARGGFVFEDAPLLEEAAVTPLHDPAYVSYLRETSAELGRARGATPRFVVP